MVAARMSTPSSNEGLADSKQVKRDEGLCCDGSGLGISTRDETFLDRSDNNMSFLVKYVPASVVSESVAAPCLAEDATHTGKGTTKKETCCCSYRNGKDIAVTNRS